MKTCFKCLVAKPLSEFYAHPKMADGHLNKCKDCSKKYAKIHRVEHNEEIKAYDRERGQTEHRREQQHKRNRTERRRAWRRKISKTEPYRLLANKLRQASKKRNPLKTKAQTAASNAIRDGRLVRGPCEICGAPKTEGHHEDYSKPLEVRWLCRKHHLERHGKGCSDPESLAQPPY